MDGIDDMALSDQRKFVTPMPGEDWTALAARILPDEPVEAAVQRLRSFNLHLLARVPPGEFLGSDVLFVEAPRHAGSSMFDDADAPGARAGAGPSTE
jgi:hypothetical protein